MSSITKVNQPVAAVKAHVKRPAQLILSKLTLGELNTIASSEIPERLIIKQSVITSAMHKPLVEWGLRGVKDFTFIKCDIDEGVADGLFKCGIRGQGIFFNCILTNLDEGAPGATEKAHMGFKRVKDELFLFRPEWKRPWFATSFAYVPYPGEPQVEDRVISIEKRFNDQLDQSKKLCALVNEFMPGIAKKEEFWEATRDTHPSYYALLMHKNAFLAAASEVNKIIERYENRTDNIGLLLDLIQAANHNLELALIKVNQLVYKVSCGRDVLSRAIKYTMDDSESPGYVNL